MEKRFLTGVHFMLGNYACVEGAIASGCRFFAGYPITPASEIAEGMARRMPEIGGVFIQMEDEIASICAVIGASWAGLKAMTATSGPGFSLMQEGIGYAAATEAPCVIVNVQRIGPSTGSIFGQQGDIMQARWGTHGNCHEMIALAPSSVQEMFDLTIEAFNLSEEYRVPVILLAEATVGHLRENLIIPELEQIKIVNRKKPTVPPEKFVPWEAPENDSPPMVAFGDGYRVYYTAHLHTEKGYPVLSLPRYPLAEKVLKRLSSKIKLNINKITKFETRYIDDAKIIVVSYGSSSRAALRAVVEARKAGIKAGHLRLITVWPFHDQKIKELCDSANTIIVAEVNNGQVVHEIQRAIGSYEKVIPLLKLADTHTPSEIHTKIKEAT
jgi:2-oxoglutarate ferredoxin oxidoreductase subunit alpha